MFTIAFSRQYAKVVVFSKLPLPNYRSDLDEKRPQREVSPTDDLLFNAIFYHISLVPVCLACGMISPLW